MWIGVLYALEGGLPVDMMCRWASKPFVQIELMLIHRQKDGKHILSRRSRGSSNFLGLHDLTTARSRPVSHWPITATPPRRHTWFESYGIDERPFKTHHYGEWFHIRYKTVVIKPRCFCGQNGRPNFLHVLRPLCNEDARCTAVVVSKRDRTAKDCLIYVSFWRLWNLGFWVLTNLSATTACLEEVGDDTYGGYDAEDDSDDVGRVEC